MVQGFAADLHIHTFLSPCAGREMNPKAIVGRCLDLGLDIIASADHNSAANIEALAAAAEGGLDLPSSVAWRFAQRKRFIC